MYGVRLLAACCFVAGLCPIAQAREWSDATGKFKVQGNFVKVEEGKVVLRKADGSTVSVPLEKLSPADREFIKANPAGEDAGNGPATAGPAAVQAIVRKNCYRCHGEDGASEGGFNFALNLDKVARTLVVPKNSAGSVLYQRLTATGDNVMPPLGESPRPTAADVAVIKDWIDAGAQAPQSDETGEFITDRQVQKLVAADIQAAAERSRRFLRYFTLTHLYNAGVSADELQTYRNAFVKLINSLSWNTELVIPQTLDPQRTVFRIDMRQLHWNLAMWEAVEQSNPYALDPGTPDTLAASAATRCRTPCVRVDWFVYAASKPPLYHVMLGLPDTAAELESLLRVNVAANIEQEQTIRAAFNRSGVSQNNRLIEWHKSPYGSYWKSYDFAGNAGRQNLFEYPLGPGAEPSQFQHDGGEMIYSLPNGLQGYFLANAEGQRIDRGPTNIVSDPKSTDRTVVNGVSCMACHYLGVIAKADEVGPAVQANRKAFTNADEILALYRASDEMNEVLEGDAKRFATAMKKLGLVSLSRSGEPISAMAHRFEQELDLQLAACEFGLSAADFLKRLDGSPAMSRRFASLRTPGGVIKRDVFATGFAEAAIELKLVNRERQQALAKSRLAAAGLATDDKSAGVAGAHPAADGEICRIADQRFGIKSLAFSSSGNWLAVGTLNRSLRVYDVATQRQVAALDRVDKLRSIDVCAFSPVRNQLIVGGHNGQLLVYEISGEGGIKPVSQFAGHTRAIHCLVISPDGKLALTGSDDRTARVWEVDSGREIAQFPALEGPVKACYVAKNGRSGLVTDGGALLDVTWSGRPDVKRTRQVSRTWASVIAAAISPDGLTLALAEGMDIHLWSTKSGNELPKLELGEVTMGLAFTPDGSRLVTTGLDKVSVWDVRRGKRLHTQTFSDGNHAQCLTIAPDGKSAAVGGLREIALFRLPPPP